MSPFYWASVPDKEGRMKKEQMIQLVAELLQKMYYEDVEFFYKFAAGFARKKGIQ